MNSAKCKWNPQIVTGIRNCKRIPQTASGFRILFITKLAYEELKARAGTLTCSTAEFTGKDLTIISGIHEKIKKRLLTKSVDVNF